MNIKKIIAILLTLSMVMSLPFYNMVLAEENGIYAEGAETIDVSDEDTSDITAVEEELAEDIEVSVADEDYGEAVDPSAASETAEDDEDFSITPEDLTTTVDESIVTFGEINLAAFAATQVEITASNTNAGEDHIVNAKNQDNVKFGNVARIGNSNNFELTVTGEERLVKYASSGTKTVAAWFGVLISYGSVGVTDLYIKTPEADKYPDSDVAEDKFTKLDVDDVTEAITAGGVAGEFVYWFLRCR